MVPFSYLTFCPENPASGRWDQAWITRILNGEEWLPPAGFRYSEEEYDFDSTHGRVIVFSAGHYSNCDSCTELTGRRRLQAELDRLDWAVVIATSDECSLFRWDLFELPAHARLWVQTPRPAHNYPTGTFGFPLGSPSRHTAAPDGERDIDIFFSGQTGHERRDLCIDAIANLAEERPDLKVSLNPTEGFAQGMPPAEYMQAMARSKIVPCPSGPCTQDTFRLYEALETGGWPVRDLVRPGGAGAGYWEAVGMLNIGSLIQHWDDLDSTVDVAATDWAHLAASASSRWQRYKRRVAHRLDADVWSAAWDWSLGEIGGGPGGPDDEITVIIPTSPIPSHPDTWIIEQTILSVRERLPTAEILITCDGVRDEQFERYPDYTEYLRRLTLICNAHQNVCPIIFHDHQHQSGMLRQVLAEVHTPFVLYVEHDCPLVDHIDFDRILQTMSRDELASMRLFHETEVQPGSEHLFLPKEEGRDYVRTVQWSQRPHVARIDWYRDVAATYFGVGSRTMIEDVMHGVVQADLPTWKPNLKPDDQASWERAIDKAWRAWRLAVYAPAGSWKRSGHLDGRSGDPKYEMLVAYDGDRPPGAPAEGVLS